MIRELERLISQYDMLRPGDRVHVAVSGGPDSMALLWGLYLLREKWGVTLCAAHFNHGLRGAESDGEEDFVRRFCALHEIPLEVGRAAVTLGEKGLEAAAREARYRFLESLPGKIATAHTADDNTETVLMHLVRGTGLRGLGGIAPVRGQIIRPMLTVTRQQVMAFLQEYHIPFCEDSSNQSDDFLRNRLRHHVMPLLREENPRLVTRVTDLALLLRQEDALLDKMAHTGENLTVSQLRTMEPALRKRYLCYFLKEHGISEPEQTHIAAAEQVVLSEKPSASARLPGQVVLQRSYDVLEVVHPQNPPQDVVLATPGEAELPEWGIRLRCTKPVGPLTVRSRRAGDCIVTSGGTKSLKKLFIDKKIPAHRRSFVPVVADEKGVVWVAGVGFDRSRCLDGLVLEYLSADC